MQVELYDKSNIDTIEWPDTEEGRLAKEYLLPLIQEGPENYISNAKTDLYLIKIESLIVPISVNEREYENSYLLSSYFVVTELKEKLEKASAAWRFLTKPLIAFFGQLLKWIKINKVVIINNWLFSTNLYPPLTKSQIEAITLFLKKRFPDHYFMFRSVNTYKDSTVFDGLNLQNYRMIPSRQVYLYDPHRPQSQSTIVKQRKDSKRLIKAQYYVETVDTFSDEEIARLLELYRNVYVNRYTKYSPLYTEKYLKQALKNKFLNFKLLKKEGKIYGVTGFLKKDGYMLTPFFGYDTSVPQEEGLYRMLSSVILEEVSKCELLSHQGSGSSNFKKWRGFIEQQEYVAIYDHHLPLFRRLFWFLGEKFSTLFQH